MSSDNESGPTLAELADTFMSELWEATRGLDWVSTEKWDNYLIPGEENRNMLMLMMGYQLGPHLSKFLHTNEVLENAFTTGEHISHSLDLAQADFNFSGLGSFLVVDWEKLQDKKRFGELVELYWILVRGISISQDWIGPS